jgi:hypothetical protein
MQFLLSVQDSALGVWMRESEWGLFGALILHTISMGFLAGTGIALSLRVMGLPRTAPMGLYRSLLPIMEIGFVISTLSGLLLVVGYPAKAATNPIFYLKIALLVGAFLLTRRISRRLLNDPEAADPAPVWARRAAIFSIVCWAGGVTAGRMLGHTSTILLL